MAQSKSIILITAIGMIIFFSGCTGTNTPDKNVAENSKPTLTDQAPAGQTPAVQTPAIQTPAAVPPFQIQVTEAKTLEDCIIQTGQKQSCFIINLEVKNNIEKSIDFKILQDAVITKSGKQAGDRYDAQVGLSNLCVRPLGLEFKLDAASSHTIGMCYPPVSKSEGPTFKVTVSVNGERKEYSFDVSNI